MVLHTHSHHNDNINHHIKWTARRLERTYNRSSALCSARDAWRCQCQRQRLLFRRKAADYWSTTTVSVAMTLDCCGQRSVSCCSLAQCQLHHSANDLANHFTLKVDNVRQSTFCTSPPVINKRNTFWTLHSETVEDSTTLSTRSPAKQCPLDPVPAWLLKRAAEQFARILPLSQKHTLVNARLKKSTLDPEDLKSYRSISQLWYLIEIWQANRFPPS